MVGQHSGEIAVEGEIAGAAGEFGGDDILGRGRRGIGRVVGIVPERHAAA